MSPHRTASKVEEYGPYKKRRYDEVRNRQKYLNHKRQMTTVFNSKVVLYNFFTCAARNT